MSVLWAERQRRTNYLVRKVANYLFQQTDISADQLYGLSQLTWITPNHYHDINGYAPYVESCKIPAFQRIFNRKYSSIKDVSDDVSSLLGDDAIIELINSETGFTNFYPAYRNSVLEWTQNNMNLLLPMYKCAFNAKCDDDIKDLIKNISQLPLIPKANHFENPDCRPENFLTPVFFALNSDIRFPIINGNEKVVRLLKKLKVQDRGLESQYNSMIRLYNVGGITDAADLDQIGAELCDFITIGAKKASKKLLESKETDEQKELPLKDENDVLVIYKSINKTQRRIHNQLTNKLKLALSDYTLLEGCDNSCMFDVLIKNCFEKGKGFENRDLLIEVKSSIEISDIRMAVGQLFDYWFRLKGDVPRNLAILLPERPKESCVDFLKWMEIYLMWFENESLCTADE